MNCKYVLLGVIILLLVVVSVAYAATNGFSLGWWTVDGGGGTSQGGEYAVSGTIGQPDTSPLMSGGDYEVVGGFWGGGLCPILWQSGITISNNGTDSNLLTIGQGTNATDGIDDDCGEERLLPLPPASVFDVRLELPNGIDASLIDYRPADLDSVVWDIALQPGEGGYPMTLTWDPAALPVGSVHLKDSFGGILVDVDMKVQSSYSLTNSTISALKVEYRGEVCLDVAVSAGWNMVSVPFEAGDMTLSSLFPDIVPPAYDFNGSYQAVALDDLLQTGVGYWMFFNAAYIYPICGLPVVDQDVPVSAGWNMIGPFDQVVTVANISSTPADILIPPLYGFNGAYINADSLEPGAGYWVYVTEAGTLHLGASGPLAITSQPMSQSLPQNFRILLQYPWFEDWWEPVEGKVVL